MAYANIHTATRIIRSISSMDKTGSLEPTFSSVNIGDLTLPGPGMWVLSNDALSVRAATQQEIDTATTPVLDARAQAVVDKLETLRKAGGIPVEVGDFAEALYQLFVPRPKGSW